MVPIKSTLGNLVQTPLRVKECIGTSFIAHLGIVSILYYQHPVGRDAQEWPIDTGRLIEDMNSAASFYREMLSNSWKWPYWPNAWTHAALPEPNWHTSGRLNFNSEFGFYPDTTPSYTNTAPAINPNLHSQDGFASRVYLYDAFDVDTTKTGSGWTIRGIRNVRLYPPCGLDLKGYSQLLVCLRFQSIQLKTEATSTLQTYKASGSIVSDFPETMRNSLECLEAMNGGTDLIWSKQNMEAVGSLTQNPSLKQISIPMPSFEILDESMLDPEVYEDTTIQGKTNFATIT